MKAKGERGCMNLLMPDLSTRQRCVVILSPERQPPGPIEQGPGWASDSIWTFGRNKSHAPCQVSSPDSSRLCPSHYNDGLRLPVCVRHSFDTCEVLEARLGDMRTKCWLVLFGLE